MHFSDHPPRPASARLALLTVCALLTSLVREAAAGGLQRSTRGRSGSLHIAPDASPVPGTVSLPYLLVGPPPGLRFAEPVEISPSIPSPITAPGAPGADDTPEEVAAPEQAAVSPSPAPTHAEASVTPSPAPSAPDDAPPVSMPGEPPRIGVSILPDDTPRAIRAEDVLVYFRFPASSPSGGPPPRSSATYKQQ